MTEPPRPIEYSCLSEFQTPTVFNCDFDFPCSTFYRSPKIVKIIIYILYIYENISPILMLAIQICGFGNVINLFQSCRIPFYIKVLHRFSKSVNGDYKIKSHSKQNGSPRYTTGALRSPFHLETGVKRMSLKLAFKDS
jgi:hypothetical protein